MYDRGIVHEVDVATHRVRVKLPQRQDLVTGWLDVLVLAAHGGERVHGLPKVGTQVALMLDERAEAGCVLGAIYSSADPAPGLPITTRRMEFGDGGVVEYDAAAHVLRLTVPAGGTLELAGAAEPIALADKVSAQLSAIQTALDSHVHPAGALVAPPLGGPCAGVTGAASSGYSPSSVASARAKSA